MTETVPIVVGLGELLWDEFPDGRRPGGAPANVAFHANQLGLRGVVCSRVGQDEPGDALLDFLRDHGLETTYIQRDADRPTGRVTVETDDAGSPRYTIHEHVAWDAIDFDPQTADLMAAAAAVCFGSLAQRSPTSRDSIHRALAATGPECLRVFDVNIRQQWYDREGIERSLRSAGVLKLNDEEVPVLAELCGLPGNDAETFARAVQERFGVGTVCLTRGANGCLLVGETETADVPGTPVTVRDTVGAGDAFTAAFIAARLWGWPPATTGRFANRVGGLIASREGAMPSLHNELDRLKVEFAAGG